jgi:hypothetical protein
VLQQNHFDDIKLLNTHEDEIIIESTMLSYTRWINWNKEFLEELKEEGAKDKEYLEGIQSLDRQDEKMESTLYQEEGVLYRKLKLWVPCGLRDGVLQSEYDSKVAGHMGQDKVKDLIRRNFW